MTHCVNCGTKLMLCDRDPNGDENCVCTRCRAEEAHDFDREPNVSFTREGERRLNPNGRHEYRIQAEDIKHKDRLTDDQIAGIPIRNVFEWVRTGKWKRRDFDTWLKTIRVIE